MKKIMPLTKVVVEITNEAKEDDQVSIRKAIKAWHNRLATGSIPRWIVTKFGRELFLDKEAWNRWWQERTIKEEKVKPGRPRTTDSNNHGKR